MSEIQPNSDKYKEDTNRYYASIFNRPNKKPTQGQSKIIRLIDDLVRNKPFQNSLKRIIKIHSKLSAQFQKGGYNTWTSKERNESNYINNELGEIIREYEKLKRRVNKILHSQEFKIKQNIAWKYGLDDWLINLAIAKYNGHY